MTVIFKDLDIEALKQKVASSPVVTKAFKLVKENRIAIKIVSICLIFLILVVVDTMAVGLNFGFNVKYDGKVIATVQSPDVSKTARNMAVENVSSEDAEGAISVPKLTLTLTVGNNFDTAKKVADAIIENTSDVVEASALTVNGKTVVCGDAKVMDKQLRIRKTAYYIDGAENSAEFVDKIEIKNGYYLKNDLADEISIKQAVDGLQVKTTSKIIKDTTVKYNTRTVWSSKYSAGYSKITTVGKNGITREVQLIESVNGEQTVNAILEKQVISAPVTEVVTVGTAASKSSNAAASAAGFICPLPKGQFKVAAYWGDGRNHKAIDLSADRGVAIYAAAAGTVESAGYKGDYGYNVVINHGNGIKTRYAHASALCVKAGDTVTQGQMIAAVGSTGYSTGNHLHFEVIVNGTRVNPAPYINLG